MVVRVMGLVIMILLMIRLQIQFKQMNKVSGVEGSSE